MSQQQFNPHFGETKHRSDTTQSLVDPLENPMLGTAAEGLEPVKSEKSAATQQLENVETPVPVPTDTQSQYTLDSESENSKQYTAGNVPPTALTQEEPTDNQLARRRSSILTLKDAVVEFNRKKPLLMFLRVYLEIFVIFIAFLAIYWGSFYKRFDRFKHTKFLVVVEDEEINGIPPYLGQTVNETLLRLPHYGKWITYDTTSFMQVAAKHNNTVEQEFYRQVHHQNYWGGFHIRPNSTYNLYEAMRNINTSIVNETFIECVYETARDLLGMTAFFEPNLRHVQDAILNSSSLGLYQGLINNNLTATQKSSLFTNASEIVTSKSFITSVDYRPMTVAAGIGPSLMGLVYCLVLSFHQFNFAARIHAKLIVKLKTRDFLWFRLLSSQVTFFFLSLVYSLMTLAFQVPVTTTFGRSGFLVLWATIFLYFSALGGINENVATFIVARNRAYIGFWIVFFIVSNVSPTFYPILLCPTFFRYGYAFPMHSAHEIVNVILFNTWKGNLGRDYAILVAWIVITNISLPFMIKNGQKHLAKVAAAEAKKKKQ